MGVDLDDGIDGVAAGYYSSTVCEKICPKNNHVPVCRSGRMVDPAEARAGECVSTDGSIWTRVSTCSRVEGCSGEGCGVFL